jgi:hypothetical protein
MRQHFRDDMRELRATTKKGKDAEGGIDGDQKRSQDEVDDDRDTNEGEW